MISRMLCFTTRSRSVLQNGAAAAASLPPPFTMARLRQRGPLFWNRVLPHLCRLPPCLPPSFPVLRLALILLLLPLLPLQLMLLLFVLVLVLVLAPAPPPPLPPAAHIPAHPPPPPSVYATHLFRLRITRWSRVGEFQVRMTHVGGQRKDSTMGTRGIPTNPNIHPRGSCPTAQARWQIGPKATRSAAPGGLATRVPGMLNPTASFRFLFKRTPSGA